jgi:hypothetical protein
MSGTIPTNLRLRNIFYFDLSHNNFSGNLPEDIGSDFVRARVLYFDHNQFVGTIPSNYGGIGNGRMAELTLDNNQLTGEVPTDWPKDNLNLITVRFQNNKITTPIGNKGLCELDVFKEVGELLELGAECDICSCKTELCSNCY